jgi:hypothetical protein
MQGYPNCDGRINKSNEDVPDLKLFITASLIATHEEGKTIALIVD